MVHGVAESDMTEHLSTEHIYLVTFGCAGSLLLHQFSLAVDSGGLLSNCGAQASHYSGFSSAAWTLGLTGFSS